MKSASPSRLPQLRLAAGLLLGSAMLASADTLVTFQVDMTQAITAGTFVPGTSVISARGSFNGWGTATLTNNPSGANPNLYSGTFDDTTDANGGTLSYKYHIDPGDIYETAPCGGNNRTIGLPVVSGSSFVLPLVYFNDEIPATTVTDDVLFQVDMTMQIAIGAFTPGTSQIYARGSFNGWGELALTNNLNGPNPNLYSGAVTQTDAPNNLNHLKFFIDTGSNWETPGPTNADCSGNRFYNLLPTNGTLVLPPVFFDDLSVVPPVTNVVNFQVDMSAQILSGAFTPGLNLLECRGSFQGWTGGFAMTNDPTSVNSNVFGNSYTVISVPSAGEAFKYITDGANWESPITTGGNNRTFKLLTTNGSITLPKVYFSDLLPNDLVPVDTLVTFTLDMTNAVTVGGSHAFDPSADTVHINGEFLGWPAWDFTLPQLTNYPDTSTNYTIQMLIPKGKSLAVTYKYGLAVGGTGNVDNEASFGQNHVRYIRSNTGTYNMPLDHFGNMLQEISFGNLSAVQSDPTHVLVSWLGRPGVNLQTRTSLSSGSWIDHPETDAMSSTNWPTDSGSLFFRLVKPGAQ